MSAIPLIELLDKQFPTRHDLVDGFLCPGTYILAGAPKIGKSFLMAQLCYCVSAGRSFLGLPTQPATVLYLALEDTEARMQERLVRMFGPEDPGDLHLAFQIPPPEISLDDELEQFIRDHPETRLVVIDTLAMVRQSCGSDYSYSNDYRAIQHFKALADRHHITLILVHHTRKDQSDENPFNMISGTNGLLGAADGAYVIYRRTPKGNTILDVTGRDLPSTRFVLNFDQRNCLWELVEQEEPPQVQPEPLVSAVAALVGDGWAGTATELAGLLQNSAPTQALAPNALTRKLNVLTARLEQEAGLMYRANRTAASRELSFQKIKHDGDDGVTVTETPAEIPSLSSLPSQTKEGEQHDQNEYSDRGDPRGVVFHPDPHDPPSLPEEL